MDLQTKLQRLVGNNETFNSLAKVTAVDGTTCDVLLLKEDLELFDVRLQAGDGKGLLLVPKVGSYVLIGYLSKTDAYVAMVDQVESYALQTQNDSLKALILDLIAEVSKIQVSTPVGPSGTPLPPTITALESIKSRVNKFFKK